MARSRQDLLQRPHFSDFAAPVSLVPGIVDGAAFGGFGFLSGFVVASLLAPSSPLGLFERRLLLLPLEGSPSLVAPLGGPLESSDGDLYLLRLLSPFFSGLVEVVSCFTGFSDGGSCKLFGIPGALGVADSGGFAFGAVALVEVVETAVLSFVGPGFVVIALGAVLAGRGGLLLDGDLVLGAPLVAAPVDKGVVFVTSVSGLEGPVPAVVGGVVPPVPPPFPPPFLSGTVFPEGVG